MSTENLFQAMDNMGLEDAMPHNFRGLYNSCVTLGAPHYGGSAGDDLLIEVGTRSNLEQCLIVLDGLLENLTYSKSCGLARCVRFERQDDWLAFHQRLGLALWLGGCMEAHHRYDRRSITKLMS